MTKNIDFFNDLVDHKFSKQMANFEIQLYIYRKIRMDTKIQRYFNSTPLRNVFARLMVEAFYNKSPYKISELANKVILI